MECSRSRSPSCRRPSRAASRSEEQRLRAAKRRSNCLQEIQEAKKHGSRALVESVASDVTRSFVPKAGIGSAGLWVDEARASQHVIQRLGRTIGEVGVLLVKTA